MSGDMYEARVGIELLRQGNICIMYSYYPKKDLPASLGVAEVMSWSKGPIDDRHI